ncbi:MAG: undecaprenyldiphospho-muramoylpentapeptide beta-N-acetylglucosaminyltransferase [Bacteroidales bacterium]
MEKKKLRIIISGGGTGGHIFPAISIAKAIQDINPDVELLFVGAKGRMEMEKVPAAGYNIVGLPVVGLQRKLTIKNISFPIKLIKSLRMASKIISNFKPHVVVGVGGYASGPILKMAQRKNIPTVIQEQNSYAGITNRLLGKKAVAICVAYSNMDRYFPKDKIVLTGNPIRQGLENIDSKIEEGRDFFGVPAGNKVVLVVGGSLGARTINESLWNSIEKIANNKDITLIWQTGKYYYDNLKTKLQDKGFENIKLFDFIQRMDMAFAASNLVVSRAGACTISELCLVGKPTILVPSPNVAEDHQTKNANALAKINATILIHDKNAAEHLTDKIIETLKDDSALKRLETNIRTMALPNAANDIARIVVNLGAP